MPDTFHNRIHDHIEAYRSGLPESNLYAPIAYMMGLGGKRMRPMLTLLATDLFNGNIDEALDPALAVEVFHNFTLLHDDIMDNAPVRRGLPTVFQKWGTSSAILSGDVMCIHSYAILAGNARAWTPRVIRELNQVAIEVCEGQQLDMDFEQLPSVSLEQYIEMIRLKTACLLAGSLRIGAIVAGASDRDVKLISDFGENMGIAFQIMDDYLDAFGDQDKVGKVKGGDIMAGKKTFLVVEALSLSDRNRNDELIALLADKSIEPFLKVEKVMAHYRELGVEEATLKAAGSYTRKAMEALDAISAPVEQKQRLIEYLNAIARRQN